MKYTLTIECDSYEEALMTLSRVSPKLTPQPHPTYPPSEHPIPPEDNIRDLDLTVRAENCLMAEGIYSISTLAKWDEQTLLTIPNLGRRTLNDIKECLAGRNILLGRTYTGGRYRDTA
jgi:DNA-directed RNA polymerase subunit alpha